MMEYSKRTMPPFTQLELFSHGLKSMKGNLAHFPWPAQSPDLNITEPLRLVLQTRVKIRLPPPKSLKQLENVLQE
jgi:hypothetical protein